MKHGGMQVVRKMQFNALKEKEVSKYNWYLRENIRWILIILNYLQIYNIHKKQQLLIQKIMTALCNKCSLFFIWALFSILAYRFIHTQNLIKLYSQ